jgi:dTMP kinase
VAVKRGRFITLEGGEGAGKSTLAAELTRRLRAAGRVAVATREPGGAPGAEAVRQLLVTGERDRWDPMGEALLLSAARRDHVLRLIKPSLAAGSIVLCDRFYDSTLAYQGYGHGLPRRLLDQLRAMVVGRLKPDLTLILDLPASVGLARAQARRGDETRFESFDLSFHERLRAGFLAIAAEEPERCVVIDAAQTPEAVAAQAWSAVAQRLRLDRGPRAS